MIAYKLMRLRKDGTVGPLFINRRLRIPLNTWMTAEDHPTRGFAHRPGFHCTAKPIAPHLKLSSDRVWYAVEIADFTTFERPQAQGGIWLLAQRMRLLRKL
jgi:hypothetical protein